MCKSVSCRSASIKNGRVCAIKHMHSHFFPHCSHSSLFFTFCSVHPLTITEKIMQESFAKQRQSMSGKFKVPSAEIDNFILGTIQPSLRFNSHLCWSITQIVYNIQR